MVHTFVEGPKRELVLVPDMGHAFDPISIGWICRATSRLLPRNASEADGTGVLENSAGSTGAPA